MQAKTQPPGLEEKMFGFVDLERGLKKWARLLNRVHDYLEGMRSIFDFSKEHNSGTRFLNVMGVTGFDIWWFLIVLTAMTVFRFSDSSQILGSASPIGMRWLQTSLPAGVGHSPIFEFFFGCVLAPLWETLVFVCLPVFLAGVCTYKRSKKIKNLGLLLFVLCASAGFGMAHGGPPNIMVQGVGGALYLWLYLRNKSYWSPVIAHVLWNFMFLFVLPALLSLLLTLVLQL